MTKTLIITEKQLEGITGLKCSDLEEFEIERTGFCIVKPMQIIINNKQIKLLLQFVEENNMILAKHLPDSSVFKSKKESWKKVWIDARGEEAWPHTKEMISACHIVDVKTRKVYLYPKAQSENAAIEGHEDESFFIAEKSLLTPFNLEDVDERSLDESPEVLLQRALNKISPL